jgi:hypothetical protein
MEFPSPATSSACQVPSLQADLTTTGDFSSSGSLAKPDDMGLKLQGKMRRLRHCGAKNWCSSSLPPRDQCDGIIVRKRCAASMRFAKYYQPNVEITA